MIVGLGGKARSGKDTVGEYLVRDHGFIRLAFADRLKALAYDSNPIVSYGVGGGADRLADLVDALGWEKAKEYYGVRVFLQRLGVGARAHLGSEVWVEPVLTEAWKLSMEGKNVVITDVRFPNEFNSIDVAGGILVKLDRPGAGLVGGGGDHVSETALDDFSFHKVISNHGTIRDLEVKIVRALDL